MVEGGGMKGYYVSGCAAVLERTRRMKVCRYAGASAGAFCCVCMCCQIDPALWATTYLPIPSKALPPTPLTPL